MADLVSSWLLSICERTDTDSVELVEALRCKVQRLIKRKGEFLYFTGNTPGFFCLVSGKVALMEPRVSKLKKRDVRKNYREIVMTNLAQSNLDNLKTDLQTKIDFFEIETSPEEEVVVDFVNSRHLRPGDSFGSRRFSIFQPETAKCEEFSELTYISAFDFEEVASAMDHTRKHRICKFLQKLPGFYGWNWIELFTLSSSCETVSYKQGEVVFREGEKPAQVFIVMTGEFEFTKHLPLAQVKTNSLGVKHQTVHKERQVRI